MALALTLLIPLQFAKKWNLPRWSVIVMVLGGAVVFYSFTEYRSQDVLNTSVADSAEALSLDSVQTALHGNEKKTEEMAGTINVISAINKTHDFGWGRGIWNASISLLVPRQFVGESFKKSLTSSWDNNTSLEKVYGGGREYYVAVTGPCGAFCEFWYLGALMFFALGRITRIIWNRANSGSVVYMLMYVGTMPTVVLIMFNDISQMIGYLAMELVPMAPLLWWISSNSQVTHRRKRGRKNGKQTSNQESLEPQRESIKPAS
jgi:hypothetical protein